jgi:hypothetical protein
MSWFKRQVSIWYIEKVHAYDKLTEDQRLYNRNLGNTVLTAIVATAVVAGLYVWQWYPSMNQIVLQLSDDTVAR